MDAVVLFHHAAEALMRLYFVHADQPVCPWMEISRRDRGGEFKQELAEFIKVFDHEDTKIRLM